MRRTLYLALVLVLLAITGLAFVRVTGASAFIVRSQLKHVQYGMARDEVLQVFGSPSQTTFHKCDWWIDSWRFGEYTLSVYYYTGCHPDDIDPTRLKAHAGSTHGPQNNAILDGALELLGFPRRAGGLLLF